MALNNYIKDPSTGILANIEKSKNKNKLHVLTEPSQKFVNRSVFFTNPTHGFNMNVDASLTSAGTEEIHNGEDTTLWTASEISANWDFSNTDQSYEGSYSIDATGTRNDSTAQFTNDAYISTNEYGNLEGWIYIERWDTAENQKILVYAWDSNAGTTSSTEYNIGNYVNINNNDVWQKFTIPMVFSNVYDSIRITTIDSGFGVPVDFYLDNLLLSSSAEGSGPYKYDVSPSVGYNWEVMGLGIAIVAPYDSTLTDATMPKIPWEGLIGVTLDNGIVYQRKRLGEIQFSVTMNHFIEIINQHDAVLSGYGNDGTDTWIKIDMNFKEPYLLDSYYQDSIGMTLNDNLSSLEYLRIVAEIREYERN